MLETVEHMTLKRLFWIPDRDDRDPDFDEPCTAELAECTCPEFCERDHDND
jgi:hypothetical protein